jgi:putative lysine transport system substrate-binding protein
MKKIVRFTLAVLMIATLLAGTTACGSAQPTQTQAPSGTPEATDSASATPTAEATTAALEEFRVGMECAYPPFNWTQITDANGAVPIDGTSEFAGGYDVEIAKKIAEGLGKKLVIVKTEWAGLPPALLSGTIDAIIAGMSPTAERKETIDFSANYYRSQLVIIVKKGGKFEKAASIADFTGAKITAQLNTFHYTVIDQITGVEKQTAMDDFGAMRVALQSGIIDGYVAERPEGISVEAAGLGLVMVDFEDGKGFTASDDDVAIAVGLKKGQPELVQKINEILAGITEEQRVGIMDQAIQNQPSAE